MSINIVTFTLIMAFLWKNTITICINNKQNKEKNTILNYLKSFTVISKDALLYYKNV